MTPDAADSILGSITINQAGAIFTRQDDGGWLRMWEQPISGRSYIVVMTGKSAAVWRQDCMWESEHKPARMIAAVVPDPRHHITVLTSWAYEMSTFYGGVLVMVDIGTCPGSIPFLKEKGCMMWMRKQRDDKRPIGQGLPVRHIGWEMTDANRMDALVQLQRMISDQTIAIPCATTRMELELTASNAANQVDTGHGYGADWLNNAAMAVMGLPSATPFITPNPVGFMPDYMMEGGGGPNFGLGNMGS